jgi:hypothetical protein
MTCTPQLVLLVRQAIQAAADGDYDLSNYSDEELTNDLLTFEDSVSTESFEDVFAAVKEVRK